MKIRYFAWIKEITNKEFDIINKNYPKSINELKTYLNKSYPALEKHLSDNILRFAVNAEYSSTNEKLDPADEIAIFPPVSGG